MSLARVAVLDDVTRHRVFALPPLWWLALFVAAAIGVAAWQRPPRSRWWPLALSAVFFLPYVPGPVPAAFLMWDGPAEGFVWAAIFAGMWFGDPLRWPRAVVSVVSEPKRAPWAAAALAAAAFAFGGWSLGDLLPGGDEPHYLVITQSLLLDRDLRIENNHERGDYRPYTDQALKPDFIQRGIDGEIYPMHAPGVSAIVLPAFAIAGYAGALLTVIAVAAAASGLGWQAAWLLTESVGAAWFAWAGVFLTTPFFFHGFTIYPDGVGGLFTAAGVWLLVMLEKRRPVSTRQLISVGFALSMLPWLHARFALIAGAIGLAIVLRMWDPRRVAAFVTAPLLVAAAWFTYFYVIWGTPNPSAPQGRDLMMSADQIWRGVAGLFFDQQFGLIAHAPVYALAVAGFISLARRHPRLALELALAGAPYLIVTSSFAAWWGGVSAPARYFAALLPLAVPPLAWWWRERGSLSWRSLTLLTLLLSVATIVPKLVVDGGLLVYNDRAGFDFFLDWAAQSVDLPLAFPSLHRDSVTGAVLDTAIWITAAALAAALALSINRKSSSRGAVWTSVAALSVVAIMSATTIVWARHDVAGIRPAASQLALLRARPPAEVARALEVRNVRRAVNVGDSAVLRASRLPAGEYELVIDPSASGPVWVEVGRTDQAIERWQPGQPPLTLALPVDVHSVTVRADPGGSVRDARLRVRDRYPAAGGGMAQRAIRYGPTRAFFMDDSSYMEPSGFWTRGEESTTIVFAPDRPGAWTLLLQSGPVPTSVHVSMGDWSERLEFAAHQQRPVTVPPTRDGVRVLKLQTGAWFRPSDRDPRDRDTRRLGVFGIVP